MQTAFSLGANLVGFEVDEQGQAVVAFGRWKPGEDEAQEVEHVLTVPGEVLLGIAVRGQGLPVTISENGHRVKLTDAELRQLRDMLQAAETLLANYQGWLAEQAPRGVTVPVAREWALV
jgi:hypothetical protein